MLTKLAALTTATIAAIILAPGTASAAQIITEPTHIPLDLTPGATCEFTVTNGRSVHSNTTVIVQDPTTWENLVVMVDVEREAHTTVTDDQMLVVPESGNVTVQVIPNEGGISSLDPSDFTCNPVIIEVVEPVIEVQPTIEPVTEIGPEPVTIEPPAPVEEATAPEATPEPIPETTPEPEPVEEAVTPEPEPVEETIDASAELAHTGTYTKLMSMIAVLLVAVGAVTRKISNQMLTS